MALCDLKRHESLSPCINVPQQRTQGRKPCSLAPYLAPPSPVLQMEKAPTKAWGSKPPCQSSWSSNHEVPDTTPWPELSPLLIQGEAPWPPAVQEGGRAQQGFISASSVSLKLGSEFLCDRQHFSSQL